MSDDPFAEPGDPEHTVIRPRPGGRASSPPPPARPASVRPTPAGPPPQQPARAAPQPVAAPATAVPSAASPAVLDFDAPSGSPLPALAMPLLQLLARLRNAAQWPDPADLHKRTVAALQSFQQGAGNAGVPADQIGAAHYALCASIDEAVLNTPWGADSQWARRTLTAAFHRDQTEGGRFAELLTRMMRSSDHFMPVIEIMYLCLSLGVMGRYRTAAQGPTELQKTRAELCALITSQKSPGPDLSPRWRGVAAPYVRSRAVLPLWVVYAAALALCGGLFFAVSTTLNVSSDAVYARMLAAPPASMPVIARATAVRPPPPPPSPVVPTILDRLRASLETDIDAGTVSVVGTAALPVVRVSNHDGFAARSAVLPRTLAAVLGRVGAALKTEPGQIEVTAYTDDRPIRTVRFPSNFALSNARAKAAAAVLARAIGNPARVGFQGRADADPIASNATAAGRAQNNRLDIALRAGA